MRLAFLLIILLSFTLSFAGYLYITQERVGTGTRFTLHWAQGDSSIPAGPAACGLNGVPGDDVYYVFPESDDTGPYSPDSTLHGCQYCGGNAACNEGYANGVENYYCDSQGYCKACSDPCASFNTCGLGSSCDTPKGLCNGPECVPTVCSTKRGSSLPIYEYPESFPGFKVESFSQGTLECNSVSPSSVYSLGDLSQYFSVSVEEFSVEDEEDKNCPFLFSDTCLFSNVSSRLIFAFQEGGNVEFLSRPTASFYLEPKPSCTSSYFLENYAVGILFFTPSSIKIIKLNFSYRPSDFRSGTFSVVVFNNAFPIKGSAFLYYWNGEKVSVLQTPFFYNFRL